MGDSQGARAVRQGQENREDVFHILLRHDFEQVDLSGHSGLGAMGRLVRHQDTPRLVPPPPGVFAREVLLGTTVYGTEMREDGLIYRSGWTSPLAIATRHQASSGSARERLEYLFSNINEQFPCPCIVILEGSELEPVRKRAREWVHRSRGRLALVFDGVQDFRRWVTNGLPYPTPPISLGI